MMKHPQSRRKHFLYLVSLCATLLLASCIGTDEMRWKEQVWMHEGQRILLERSSTRTKSGFPTSRRGAILSQEIIYGPLDVLWRVNGDGEQPLSFEVIDGDAYLVTIAPGSLADFCSENKGDDFSIVVYRWRKGEMHTVDQLDAPLNKMGRNLSGISHWGYQKSDDRTYLSADDVAYATMRPIGTPPVPLRTYLEGERSLRCK